MAIAGKISASSLWQKIASLVTGSVSKNLHIEDQIACTLNSTHILFHLLCVSHTCEVFDKGNLSVLCDLESKIELREKLIQHMPMLKSFLSKNKCVAVAALQAFSKLAINDSHKSSHHEEFNHILSVANKSNKFSAFKERRLAQLGYTAASIIHHLPDFKALLENP